jgi:cell division protein FtsZ
LFFYFFYQEAIQMIMYDTERKAAQIGPKITVIGIGGAGGNAINTIAKQNIKNIECIAINTDSQALESVNCASKLQIGIQATNGMGTGSNPEIGKASAEESIEQILDATKESDIVFLIAGLGGGTGSGALPIIAQFLQEQQILTVGIVTKPFMFEGARRMNIATSSMEFIEDSIDTLITIPNQKLFEMEDSENASLYDAFERINMVISDCIKAVSETIYNTGNINVDFADIKSIMTGMGRAVIGIGRGKGETRAEDAIEGAITSKFLENTSLKGTRSILVNINCDKTLSLQEMNLIASYMHEKANSDAHIIIGSTLADNADEELTLTIIATGFEDQMRKKSYINKNPYLSKPKQNKFFNQQINEQQQRQQHGVTENYSNQQDYQQNKQPDRNELSMNNDLDIPAFYRKNNVNTNI